MEAEGNLEMGYCTELTRNWAVLSQSIFSQLQIKLFMKWALYLYI